MKVDREKVFTKESQWGICRELQRRGKEEKNSTKDVWKGRKCGDILIVQI